LTPDRLDRRTLNRSLLARQHLLARAAMSAHEMVEALVGMQAQEPYSAYAGLWSRIDGFRPGDLAQLLLDRRVVRMVVMRSTIHLVTDRDALRIWPLLRGMLAKDPFVKDVDVDAAVAAARTLVEAEPRTPAELGRLLQAQLPASTTETLIHTARSRLPLVQVPPRGVWGVGGTVRLTTAESWLDAPLDEDATIDDLVVRYLRAFGPAAPRDFTSWSRLTGAREVFERLRPSLRTFRDDDGVELFDVPDGVLVDGDVDAPVRIMPEYDNVMLAHHDRRRIMNDVARAELNRENGYRPFVLVDGEVVATWAWRDGFTRVEVTPFAKLTTAQRAEVDAEVGRLETAFSAG
jgi:hypothetical protein